MLNAGKLITIEGADGAGKTTQINLLKEKYKDNSQYFFTRNPGGTELGQQLRSILLNNGDMHIAPMAELFMYMADRAHHIEVELQPKLDEGINIICDRYIDSTLAYQGYGRDLDKGIINELNNIAIGSLRPDLTIVLDIDTEIALARATDKNRFEAEGAVFQSKIRHGFLEIAKQEPERVKVISVNNKFPEDIHTEIVSLIHSL